MPVVALPPNPPVVHIRENDDAFGNEASFVIKEAQRAEKHWKNRAEWILAESDSTEEEFDYEPVPLKQVGRVKVRLKFVGPLKPMPYEWDE